MEKRFDRIIDRRNTNSYKWDVKENELPMFVADMDFEVAPSITKTLSERISHPIFGYSTMPDSWHESYHFFFKERYGWEIERDNLLFSLGIIPTISTSVRAFTDEGDEVIVFTPVYHVFFHSIENNKRKVIKSPLKYENGHYSIDWVDFENKISSPKCKMLILCNPHNPCGRIWNKDELERIGILCKKHNILVVSDEVHGPITRPGKEYVPFASVNDTNKEISIIALAPTKAWNIAGIQTSAAYAYNKVIRNKLEFALNADEVMEGNVFSYLIPRACFIDGIEWLDEMREYVYSNIETVKKYIEENIPSLSVSEIDATYLMWIDISKISKNDEDFCSFMRETTGLYVSKGSTFGEEGKGFFRLNVACPRSVLLDGLNRLKKAVDNYKE